MIRLRSSARLGETPGVRATARRREVTARHNSRRSSWGGRLQVLFDDLPERVTRQSRQEDEVAGYLEAGDAVFQMRSQLLPLNRRPSENHHERPQSLPELLVGRPDHRHLRHRGVTGEDLLDLAREDVLPSREDHVVGAPVNEQPAGRVQVAEIAGAHMTVDH